MQTYSEAEIQRKPIDDLLLQMKALNIRKVCNFPFPSPPKRENIEAAENRLILLGALEDNGKGMFLQSCFSLNLQLWCVFINTATIFCRLSDKFFMYILICLVSLVFRGNIHIIRLGISFKCFMFFTGDFASGITGLGMTMASLPVSPRFGKMLSLSHQQGLLPLAVWLVAAMTVPELLLERPLTSANAQTSAGPDKDDHKRLQALRCAWVGQVKPWMEC